MPQEASGLRCSLSSTVEWSSDCLLKPVSAHKVIMVAVERVEDACSSPADAAVLVTDRETNLGNGRLQGEAADVRVGEVGSC